MEKPLLVYTTLPDMGSAEALAQGLVAARLAACVNLIPEMRSVYRWKGAIETAREVVAIVKTREGRGEEVRAHIRANHPYDTPIVVFLPVSGGDAGTLEWLMAETSAS